MARPAPGTALCRLGEIADPGAKGLGFGAGAGRFEMVIARAGGTVRAFVNSCPHQGTPLETFPDRFLTRDGAALLCTTHGARFHLEDGRCFRGPCRGRALEPVAIAVRDGVVFMKS